MSSTPKTTDEKVAATAVKEELPSQVTLEGDTVSEETLSSSGGAPHLQSPTPPVRGDASEVRRRTENYRTIVIAVSALNLSIRRKIALRRWTT